MSDDDKAEEAAPAPPAFDKEELKRALKAFKKRLKVTRRDEESKIGRSAFSSGKASGIVGIVPPAGFPDGIWEALVAKGRLKPIPGTQRNRQYELITPS